MSKGNSKNMSMEERKEDLIRELDELNTLYGVNACMIICPPEQGGSSGEPEIWPQDPNKVKRLVNMYKAQTKEFAGLNKEELAKKKLDEKYPIILDHLKTEAECLQFLAVLTEKEEHVRELIKRKKMNQALTGDGNKEDTANDAAKSHD